MTIRDYHASRDLKAVRRIWKEVGWLDKEEGEEAELVKTFFDHGSDAIVGEIDGVAECAVIGADGTMNYQDEILTLGGVMGVTTSRVARKQGFAARMTAMLVARQAERGMNVSALGMFDQGFYDKVGFGSGNYEQWIKFDPATLNIDATFRPPKRLGVNDYAKVHEAMHARERTHGGVSFDEPELMRAELAWIDEPFGLGYFDGPNGELTHFIFGSAKGEHGPYDILWRGWQTPAQLMELLALIKSFGDQVYTVGMLEFGDIQLQDLLEQPMRHRRTREGKHANESRSMAYWQMRVNDVEACLAKTKLLAPTLRFNLTLTDPIERYLTDGQNWTGVGGDYIVSLGEQSSAERGNDASLPTLEASVNAFSRMWFGIRPASSLAVTESLRGDDELLKALDRTLRLPRTHLGWDF